MATKLTKKQRGFVKDYIDTGIGSLAVKKNYDTTDDNTARNIASENLTKPNIVKAIQEALPDVLLAENHLKLFKQVQTNYFVFPKSMSDEEIVEHVNANGIDVITVRESEKGKMAFYSIPDSNAIKSGLDMAYKIKGSYAPEKSTNLNLNVDAKPSDIDLEELVKEVELKLKEKKTQ